MAQGLLTGNAPILNPNPPPILNPANPWVAASRHLLYKLFGISEEATTLTDLQKIALVTGGVTIVLGLVVIIKELRQ